MTTAVVDYGSGNLRSAAKALERAAAESGLGMPVTVTSDAAVVARAERVVLPGVGAFADCRRGLSALPGMIEALDEAVIRRARPFLGICVGMQLMATVGREHEETPGFDWISGTVIALQPKERALKVPQIGWNALDIRQATHPLFAGLEARPYFYFVHSYHLQTGDPSVLLATADYGGPIAAAVGRANLAGTQFHPEKSQVAGLKLLANFLRWRP
ncbi:MAG: imidazole glycerol phosphate synthase subunit HisH [Kiloniellales bacterium]